MESLSGDLMNNMRNDKPLVNKVSIGTLSGFLLILAAISFILLLFFARDTIDPLVPTGKYVKGKIIEEKLLQKNNKTRRMVFIRLEGGGVLWAETTYSKVGDDVVVQPSKRILSRQIGYTVKSHKNAEPALNTN